MKKKYTYPQMEHIIIVDTLPICMSGIGGDSVVEDIGYDGIDTEGEKDPS